MSSKLVLGSAQFGSCYGISRRSGRLNVNVVKEILAVASDSGIDEIDTAITYGSSELNLGLAGVSQFKVTTKLPKVPSGLEGSEIKAWVRAQISQSLLRLKLDSIYRLIVHDEHDCIGEKAKVLFEALESLRHEQLLENIGVSVYSPEILRAIGSPNSIDTVQFPINLCDRRFFDFLEIPDPLSTTVSRYGRSIFLQGLLLMEVEKIPSYFSSHLCKFVRWKDMLREQGVDAIDVCLGFINDQKNLNKVVVGCESVAQLRRVLEFRPTAYSHEFDFMASDALDLIDPRRWKI